MNQDQEQMVDMARTKEMKMRDETLVTPSPERQSELLEIIANEWICGETVREWGEYASWDDILEVDETLTYEEWEWCMGKLDHRLEVCVALPRREKAGEGRGRGRGSMIAEIRERLDEVREDLETVAWLLNALATVLDKLDQPQGRRETDYGQAPRPTPPAGTTPSRTPSGRPARRPTSTSRRSSK